MLNYVTALQTDHSSGQDKTTSTNRERGEHHALMIDYKSYYLSGRTRKVIKSSHNYIICIFANAAHFSLIIHLHNVMDFLKFLSNYFS